VPSRWLSRRAFRLHAEFGAVVAGCVAATWWQATRALSGNFISWFYTVEWPVLAVLAVWGWWHLMHEDPEAYRARTERQSDWDWPENHGAR